MSDLLVSEIFGPTIQGEGPSLGQRAMFLRLGLCPLKCSFCDTKYAWPEAALKSMSNSAIIKTMTEPSRRLGTNISLVVTGGEPLVQEVALVGLLKRLVTYQEWRIEVETSGIIAPSEDLRRCVDLFVVSPKLTNAGVLPSQYFSLDALRALHEEASSVFKFVVTNLEDLEEVEELVGRIGVDPQEVYVMPEGVSSEALLQNAGEIASAAILRGWNVTTRLHILLWGNKRGV